MGWITDCVEAEAGGHHFALRSEGSLLGVHGALYVDGRKRDWGWTPLFRAGALTTLVDEQLLYATFRLGLGGCRYRLFFGLEELLLRVEPGASSAFVVLAPPRSAVGPEGLPPRLWAGLRAQQLVAGRGSEDAR